MALVSSNVLRASSNGLSRLTHMFKKKRISCECPNRVKGKVAVITGATSGIGYFTALDLAKKGSILYLGCRNKKAGEETTEKLRRLSGNEQVYSLYLDLTVLSTIKDFVNAFKKKEKSLDLLINNAAIFHQPSTLTKDGFEVTFQTNYLGAYLLTTQLQDYVLQSQISHIVFVSSEAHKLVCTEDLLKYDIKQPAVTNEFMDYVKVYGISKLAVHVYADYFSRNNPGACVTLVNPGNVWTNIYRNCWTSWRDFPTRVKCALFMRDPEEGAQSTIHALNVGRVLNRKYVTENLEAEDLKEYSSVVTNHLITTSNEALGL